MSCYLVTGATGFVGLPLSHYLHEMGHEVRGLCRSDVQGVWSKTCAVDLANEPPPADILKGVDGVFHLANLAHSHLPADQEWRYQAVNVEGTRKVLSAAVESGVRRFVYMSSVKAMSDPGDRCVSETWPCSPEDAYGLSKIAAERLVHEFGKEHAIHVSILRPVLVYGPKVKGNLEAMLRMIKRGVFPPVPEFNNRRSMVSLDDLVHAGFLAMTEGNANQQVYIVADGKGYSTRGIYLDMCEALDVRVPAWKIPAFSLVLGGLLGDFLGAITGRKMALNSLTVSRLAGSACYDPGKLMRELNWKPRYDLRDLLPAMVAGLLDDTGVNPDNPGG